MIDPRIAHSRTCLFLDQSSLASYVEIGILLGPYLKLLSSELTKLNSKYFAVCRLTFEFSDIVLRIARDGFDFPSESTEQIGDESETSLGNGEGGTGMATGKGQKDVTDEFEESELIDDLENAVDDDNSFSDNAENDNDNGIEMANEFNGREKDMSVNEQYEDQSNSDNDLDDHLDEFSNEDVVDESFWNELSERDDEEDLAKDDIENATDIVDAIPEDNLLNELSANLNENEVDQSNVDQQENKSISESDENMSDNEKADDLENSSTEEHTDVENEGEQKDDAADSCIDNESILDNGDSENDDVDQSVRYDVPNFTANPNDDSPQNDSQGVRADDSRMDESDENRGRQNFLSMY